MMTLSRFMTRGKRTSKETRQVLREVYNGLAPAAQKALLSPEMDYHIRYQFDSTCPGTGVPYGQFVGSDGYRAPREYCVCMVSDDGDVEKVAFVVGVDDKGQQVFKEEFLSRESALLALRLMVYQNRK